jgi:hypothetical protein
MQRSPYFPDGQPKQYVPTSVGTAMSSELPARSSVSSETSQKKLYHAFQGKEHYDFLGDDVYPLAV